MPLLGNVIIRERPSRYPNEPRYKRLDFVKPKPTSDSSDSWPIIYSAEPVRGIQLYTPPPPAYYASALPAHAYYPQQQSQRFPPGHVIHRVYAPPLTGTDHHPDAHKAIEAKPAGSDSDDDDDDDNNSIVKIIEEVVRQQQGGKSKGAKKDKKKEEKKSSGHSIFDSDSDYMPISKTKQKIRVKRYYV